MAEKRSIVDFIKSLPIYLSRRLDDLQKDEIIKGKNSGLDVSLFNKPGFNWLQMREVRQGLEKGVDVSSYAKKGFNAEQLEELRIGLEGGLDISFFNKRDFEWSQMREIRLGLEKGLDVSSYARPDYNLDQMEELRFGLEKGLDVFFYSKAGFDWKQMREIRLGLERGIDVSTYAKQDIPLEQMEKIRIKQQKELNKLAASALDQKQQLRSRLKEQEPKPKQQAEAEAVVQQFSVVAEGAPSEKNTPEKPQEKVEGNEEKAFQLSKFDVTVIFPSIRKYPTTEALQTAFYQRFKDTKAAEKQLSIYEKEINKLIDHGYIAKDENQVLSITPKGIKEAKEVSREFEFTSFDAGRLFPYIAAAGGRLTKERLIEQLQAEYTRPEDVEGQTGYLINRLEKNLEYGSVYKDDKGAYSITKLGERLAKEITAAYSQEDEVIVQEL